MKTELLKVYHKYPQLIDIYTANIISAILPRKICLIEYKCVCEKKLWYQKKKRYSAQTKIKQGRPLFYPNQEKQSCKTFQVYYEGKFSDITKLILTSLKNKYIYYAIEDINSNKSLNSAEKNNLLSILSSTMIWLQNNQYTNFFDIWIGNIYIQEERSLNRFMESEIEISINNTKVILVLFYKIRLPRKTSKSLW